MNTTTSLTNSYDNLDTAENAVRHSAQRDRGRTLSQLFSLSPVVMLFSWLTIGTISAYDIYLSVKYHETLGVLELNPMGRLLIDLDCGSVALFMGLKCFGTLTALGILQSLYFVRPRWALSAAIVVALVQGTLAVFLNHG